MSDVGDIREKTHFLFFPKTIKGEKKWWTKETYTQRYTHDLHSYMGEWESIHWGCRKATYPKGFIKVCYV